MVLLHKFEFLICFFIILSLNFCSVWLCHFDTTVGLLLFNFDVYQCDQIEAINQIMVINML